MIDKIEFVLWSAFWVGNFIFYTIDRGNTDNLILSLIAVVMIKLVTIEHKLQRMESK